MMEKRWGAAVALLLLVCLAGCSGSNQLLKQRQMELAALKGQVAELEGNLSKEKARTAQLADELAQALAEFKTREQLLLEQNEANAIVTLPDAVLFSSGSVQLRSEARQILSRIGAVVDNYPDREILIEGHTDNVPIAPRFRHKYASNWELSSGRAHAVLHHILSGHPGLVNRMATIGYGEHRPVQPNNTPENRAKNRRVVMRIGPTVKVSQLAAH